mmetsp:Transcript_7292/g.21005  ORF Transcript_7292/g.21005 Transcript_7292/m.21005 type:complete len:350 (+) Transcript_7292:1782-2831(+)
MCVAEPADRPVLRDGGDAQHVGQRHGGRVLRLLVHVLAAVARGSNDQHAPLARPPGDHFKGRTVVWGAECVAGDLHAGRDGHLQRTDGVTPVPATFFVKDSQCEDFAGWADASDAHVIAMPTCDNAGHVAAVAEGVLWRMALHLILEVPSVYVIDVAVAVVVDPVVRHLTAIHPQLPLQVRVRHVHPTVDQRYHHVLLLRLPLGKRLHRINVHIHSFVGRLIGSLICGFVTPPPPSVVMTLLCSIRWSLSDGPNLLCECAVEAPLFGQVGVPSLFGWHKVDLPTARLKINRAVLHHILHTILATQRRQHLRQTAGRQVILSSSCFKDLNAEQREECRVVAVVRHVGGHA